jgi:hypothetical protein
MMAIGSELPYLRDQCWRVWGYEPVWFFLNDRIKLAAYRIFGPTQPVLTTK